MEETKYKNNNRATIIGFLIIFTLPVVMAWIAYFSGWFEDAATTNKGEWVKPVMAFEQFNPVYADQKPLLMKPGETWKLIYPGKVSQCQEEQSDSSCLINLFLIGQTHLALGKESYRVERIIFNGSATYEQQQLTTLQNRFVDLQVVNGDTDTTAALSESYIYIADPLGNIMLRYPVADTKESVFLKGKDILSDLKKLLKLSRLD